MEGDAEEREEGDPFEFGRSSRAEGIEAAQVRKEWSSVLLQPITSLFFLTFPNQIRGNTLALALFP
jgi:hypothetical protein